MPSFRLQVVHRLLATILAESKQMSLVDMRQNFERRTRAFPSLSGVAVEPVDAGGVPAKWLRPPEIDDDAGALLYAHGGGYVMGSSSSYRNLASMIAKAARAPLLSIDYRLAPEHPYPAALDDVVAAYRWLVGDGGVRPRKVALVGDSAGGGLVLSAALRIRDDAELELPAAIACMSAWTDLTCTSDSLHAGEDPSVYPEVVARMAEAYLGGRDPKTPLASPLFAELHGLPPILLQAGGAEAMLDDSKRFAARCTSAGVAVHLDVWDEMFHVFQAWSFALGEGKRAVARFGEFIRAHTTI